MKITRVYSDDKGCSCFGEIEIPLKDAGDIGLLSELQKTTGMIFRETPGDYDYMWHNTPRRQYVVNLQGGVEITVSNGEARCFEAGTVVLLEDTKGEGHCSKAINGHSRRSLFIALDPL